MVSLFANGDLQDTMKNILEIKQMVLEKTVDIRTKTWNFVWRQER